MGRPGEGVKGVWAVARGMDLTMFSFSQFSHSWRVRVRGRALHGLGGVGQQYLGVAGHGVSMR
jgi:hypothetical protein